MASYGLRVENDAGTVQIDQDFSNLALRTVGVATLAEFPINDTAYRPYAAEITYDGEFPIIFWQSSLPLTLVRTTVQGSTHKFLIVGPRDGGNNHAFRYYIYDRPPPATGNYGMIVWDAAGKQTFHSDHQYLDLVDVVGVGAAEGPTRSYGAGDYIVTNGSFYWQCLIIPIPNQTGPVNSYIYQWNVIGIMNTSDGFTSKANNVWTSGGTAAGSSAYGGPSYLMCALAPT